MAGIQESGACLGIFTVGPMLPEYKCRRGMAKMGAQEIGKEEEV